MRKSIRRYPYATSTDFDEICFKVTVDIDRNEPDLAHCAVSLGNVTLYETDLLAETVDGPNMSEEALANETLASFAHRLKELIG